MAGTLPRPADRHRCRRGPEQRSGIGTALVRRAAEQAKAAGCEWLHVDFEPELAGFYFDACGFQPTNAGLIDLSDPLPW